MSHPTSKTPIEITEDEQLKEEIETLVNRIQDKDQQVSKDGIELLRKILIGNTSSSSTTLPKTTKFLRPSLL